MANYKKKVPIKLMFWGSEPNSHQAKFERACIKELNLRPGIFAIMAETGSENAQYGYRYLHRQVQWLWKEYQKGIVEEAPKPPSRIAFEDADQAVLSMAEQKALKVACPVCAATPGQQCESDNGKSHVRRKKKADKLGEQS